MKQAAAAAAAAVAVAATAAVAAITEELLGDLLKALLHPSVTSVTIPAAPTAVTTIAIAAGATTTSRRGA